MTTKQAAWIGFWAVIIAAIITGLIALIISFRQTSPPATSISQKAGDFSTNKAAAADYMEAQHDNIKAAGPVTINNYYGDTTKQKRSSGGSGNTINVTSYNQKDGITAANVWVIKHATFISSEIVPNAEIPDNYSCVVDTINKLITIRPKAGSWNNPFIGFPATELEAVGPHFFNEHKTQVNIDTGSYTVRSEGLFGLSTTSTPSTDHLSYMLHYNQMPSKIVFGNYPKPLYEVTFN